MLPEDRPETTSTTATVIHRIITVKIIGFRLVFIKTVVSLVRTRPAPPVKVGPVFYAKSSLRTLSELMLRDDSIWNSM